VFLAADFARGNAHGYALNEAVLGLSTVWNRLKTLLSHKWLFSAPTSVASFYEVET
jgi:hypothetical protein